MSVDGEVSKQTQSAYGNHASLQGSKGFLQALIDVNGIYSQGNNQVVQCIFD